MCNPATCTRDCTKPLLPCVCDHSHDQLVDLIESGVEQRVASGIVWPECRRVS